MLRGPRVVHGFCSKENQDLFVICALNGKRHGSYLELGAYLPVHHNNTFLLEYRFGWKGLSLEADEDYANIFNCRHNPCVHADATTVDYTALLKEHKLGPHIDYLSLDIDPADQSFKALKAIDLDTHSFSVITFEHEAYRPENEIIRTESRELLTSKGYTLVVSNVTHNTVGVFEDWYVNEEHMPCDNWKSFIGDNVIMNNPHCSTGMMTAIEGMLEVIAIDDLNRYLASNRAGL